MPSLPFWFLVWSGCDADALNLGIQEGQLRYFDAQAQLIPTPEEDAAQSQHRTDRLADQLRSLGIEPEA
jgi:hypothetical protein